MSNEKIQQYYDDEAKISHEILMRDAKEATGLHRDEMTVIEKGMGESEALRERKKSLAPFVRHEKVAEQDADGEIRPTDWVVLIEGGPKLIGDHPSIQAAFVQHIAGRVISRRMTMLTGLTKDVLSRYVGKDLWYCYEYHVQFFVDQEKPFVFWEPFLRKVEVTDRTPLEIRP